MADEMPAPLTPAEVRAMWVRAATWRSDDPDVQALIRDNERLLVSAEAMMATIEALRAALAEMDMDIAQSVLESGGLPPEAFPLDHCRVTLKSLGERIFRARALLGTPAPDAAGQS